MMQRYKKRGWFNEPHRHFLAAKGISTSRSYKKWKNDFPKNTVVREVPIELLWNLRGLYGVDENRYITDTYSKDLPLKKELLRKKRLLLEVDGKGPGTWDYDLARIDDGELIQAKAEIKAKELEAEGYKVKPWKIKRNERGHSPRASIRFRKSAQQHRDEIDSVMRPSNTGVPELHVERIKDAILSDDAEVPMVNVDRYEQERGNIGEGRHRIIAAKRAGLSALPVGFQIRRDGDSYHPKFDKFDVPTVDEVRAQRKLEKSQEVSQ